jgi:uncharacterized protein (TIGR03435 family)
MDCMRKLPAILALPLLLGILHAQTRPTFEAASVKPAVIPSGVTLMPDGRIGAGRGGGGVEIPPNTGGPGTEDPGRIHYPLISLRQLLTRAWGSYHEIDGPGWLDTTAVTVDATLPKDTTKAEFQEMLRNLITERFGLRYHIGKKDLAGYALTVAPNGPKMKPSADQSDVPYARPKPPTSRDPEGFPIFPPVPGKIVMTSQVGDRSRIIVQQDTLQALASSLSTELKTIVTDATGLRTKYDFTLTYASAEPAPQARVQEGLEPPTDIFAAVQSQLGLKLERKPLPVEIFVVDQMAKTPTGN